ncbi:hypothetical protein [Actinoplanes couchii]|uniref:Transcriptional regulator n=1 Tax=Actinoplanes couchii TaxID=403638 RepID=A0ABQ3XSP4_9ACTN|nr:hypothetical protein [Actinoplanes couchii]MDR6315948.1 hypothetical protein [Actinoplanes couchii]GID61402.1 hypothetical protein Aco03nite_098060 [Actinoplanes couchii]
MTDHVRQMLAAATDQFVPAPGDNTFVELATRGELARPTMLAYVAAETVIFTSDQGSFLTLAGRSAAERQFFLGLAMGETMGLAALPALASAYRETAPPLSAEADALCRAYPSYVGWLALNADPADVVFGLLANLPHWCQGFAGLAKALRQHHGLDDASAAFLDALSVPNAQLLEQGAALLADRLAGGWRPDTAQSYARLLRSYDLLFWNTLAASQR